MRDFDANAPVIVGVGEASRKTAAGDWPSPVDLASAAIGEALQDSGVGPALLSAIDSMVALRTFEDSGVGRGIGSPDNVAEAYAKAAGLSPLHFAYADIGGQSPQAMVNEMAAAVQRGAYRAVVIAGAEANGTAKRAQKSGHALNWHVPSDTDFDNRLSDFAILNRAEIRHGIVSMPLAYSMIESARRTRLGMDVSEYARDMARLWSAFSGKSITRAHAQFAGLRDVDDLQTDANGNYALTSIYRRWMVAQDAVDLGAALILMTAGTARELGVAADKMIYLVASAEAAETPVTTRPDLSRSESLNWALGQVLEQAEIQARDLGPVDIYSCFPCAVSAAVETMADPSRDASDYSLTGGLSFFGGPGNCYTMHAIVAMVEALRRDGSKPGLITANGGVMSKQAAGIYGAQPPKTPWQSATPKREFFSYWEEGPLEGRWRVIAHSRPIVAGQPGPVSLLATSEYGQRSMAVLNEAPDVDLNRLFVTITPGEKRNIAALD